MISIGFGTNRKWTSCLIRWATGSEYSHVWVEYESSVWGGTWVAHAGPKGVVKETQENVYKKYPKHRIYDFSGDLTKGLHAVKGDVGADYDYRSVIWNGLLLVLYTATRWNYLHSLVTRNTSKLSCSEFVAKILKECGVEGTETFDPELTTPGDLERFCAHSDHFWVV